MFDASWVAAVTVVALALTPAALSAQNRQPGESDSLRQAVTRLGARLDTLEQGRCPTAPAVVLPARRPGGDTRLDSVAVAAQELSARVERLIAERCAQEKPPAQAPADTSDDLAALRAAAAAAAGTAEPADTTRTGTTVDTSTAGPRGANLLNPEISATGDIRLVARDENPQEDNAVPREFEFSFQSALDPFTKTKIFLTFEDEEFGIEEGYIYWPGLPGHLRLDVGKFRQSLGDLNRWHLHALPETEYPLVYQRFLGEDGLGGVGVSLYTPLPISIAGGTHEVWLQGTTSESDPLYLGGRQPTILGRVQNFWQLSRSSYGQVGFTATGGNNADQDLRSRLLGLDLRFTYRPPQAATRRELTVRAEGYRLHSTLAGATTNRYGAFLDLQARTSQRWIFGVRYDYAEAPRGLQDSEWRLTPAVTWWQSEFVYLRLEGEHRDSDLEGTQNLLTFQAVWAVGPHKHETY
ncbi:MAG TPA: hypothetical protein VH764_08965 [Gemmatimonadales bacterium]|jgi:hypothetical protein